MLCTVRTQVSLCEAYTKTSIIPASGHFNAYGNVVRKDSVDYVLHLGDYIYEYENGVVGKDERAVVPQREIYSLGDYRTRIGQVSKAIRSA